MIDNIRNKILGFIGKEIRFRYNGSRNQIEEFSGVIVNCYKAVFIIDVNGLIKSFTYSDVLIGNLEIDI